MSLLNICVTIIRTCIPIFLFRFRVLLHVKFELFLEFNGVVEVHIPDIEALSFVHKHLLLFINLMLSARSLTKCSDAVVVTLVLVLIFIFLQGLQPLFRFHQILVGLYASGFKTSSFDRALVHFGLLCGSFIHIAAHGWNTHVQLIQLGFSNITCLVDQVSFRGGIHKCVLQILLLLHHLGLLLLSPSRIVDFEHLEVLVQDCCTLITPLWPYFTACSRLHLCFIGLIQTFVAHRSLLCLF